MIISNDCKVTSSDNNISITVEKIKISMPKTSSREEFKRSFEAVFGSKQARTAKNVTYFWYVENYIPRLKGESNILYIGKTKQTLYQRHFRYSETETNNFNWSRYKHILEKYGDIYVCFHHSDKDPRELEKLLLTKSFFDHCELPPINGSF